MSLEGVYYPDFMSLNAYSGADYTTELWRFESVSGGFGYEFQEEFGGADPYPCFIGIDSAEPKMSFSTKSVKQVLSRCSGVNSEQNIICDLSPGSSAVNLYYQRSKNRGFRFARSQSTHMRAQMNGNATLHWDTLAAREDQDASISAVIHGTRVALGSDPLTWTGEVPIPASASQCQELYRLGPVWIGSRIVDSFHELSWENNIRPYMRRTGGNVDPDWISYRNFAPVITLKSSDLSEAAFNTLTGYTEPHNQYGGSSISVLQFFLRRKKREGIFYADSDPQHIRITCLGGWQGTIDMDGRDPTEIVKQFRLSQAVFSSGGNNYVRDGALFTIAFDSTIPAPGLAPTVSPIANQTVIQNKPLTLVTPWGTGFPTSFSATGLPSGVSINTVSGLISGVPSATGNFSVNVVATNAHGSANTSFTLAVNAPS